MSCWRRPFTGLNNQAQKDLMTVEVFISRRYFKSKPKQAIIALITLLSIIGVAIGVTALIVVIAVMGGFEADLKTRIMGIEPHLVIERPQKLIDDYNAFVETALQAKGVQSAWPLVELQAMLRSQSRSSGAVIKGVEPTAAQQGLNLRALSVLQASGSDPSQPPSIVLGQDLARSMGVVKGDTLFVVSPRGTLSPFGFVPLMKRFVVAGIFATGMYEYDSSLAFVDLTEAQRLARTRRAVQAIEIRVNDIFKTEQIGQSILTAMGPGFELTDWKQRNKNLFAALKLEKAAMFVTLTLIILVATFSITSSLVMLVMEKSRDIAVLRAIGATARCIRRIFMLQGLYIGTIGTACGVIMGTALCIFQQKYQLIRLPGDVYYITALPVDLKIMDVFFVAVAAVALCFLATLYPAHQAAGVNPVEAIRYGR